MVQVISNFMIETSNSSAAVSALIIYRTDSTVTNSRNNRRGNVCVCVFFWLWQQSCRIHSKNVCTCFVVAIFKTNFCLTFPNFNVWNEYTTTHKFVSVIQTYSFLVWISTALLYGCFEVIKMSWCCLSRKIYFMTEKIQLSYR